MYFKLDIINILILLTMVINSIYGLIIYSGNRKEPTNFYFFILTISISAWGLAMFGYRGFTDHNTVLLMSRLLYFAAITIPTAFIYFVTTFLNRDVIGNIFYKYILPIPMLLLCASSLGDNLLIYDVKIFTDSETFIVFNQKLHILFGIYVIFYFSWAYLIIFKKILRTKGVFRAQLIYILVGTLSSTIITVITNMGLLYWGIFNYNWVGQIGVIFMITLIFYSIMKFRLFNIEVIAAELLTFTVWIFILLQFFLSKSSEEKILNIALLIILIFIGILLIRNVIKEIALREKIERLATDLESLNSTLSQRVEEQTHEIKKSYELEKKAHRELEKLSETKDTFISLAQHNLRIPITNIDNKLRIILSSSEEKIGEKTKKILEEAKDSIVNLTHIANDFKDISKLKVGSQILNLSSINLKPILENIISELNIDIQTMGLRVAYPTEASSWVDLKIDQQKMREVLIVIIENAVRYNIKNGKIEIRTKTFENNFEIKIKNTGVGLTTEEINSLFNKSFYRSKRTISINPTGMGIGLSVSKSIIEAHHGTLTIESKGENTGAEVTMSLPINFLDGVEKYN